MSEARRLHELTMPATPAPTAGVTQVLISEEILTAREAQQFLKIGRTKLWDLTRTNEIPAYRVGPGNRSSLRYKRNELLHWLEGNRVGNRLR